MGIVDIIVILTLFLLLNAIKSKSVLSISINIVAVITAFVFAAVVANVDSKWNSLSSKPLKTLVAEKFLPYNYDVLLPDAPKTKTPKFIKNKKVVKVYVDKCFSTYVGSGWVSGPGEITTAGHVVNFSRDLIIEYDKKLYKSQVLAFSNNEDLAIISGPKNLPVESQSKNIKTGWAIGYPGGKHKKIVPLAPRLKTINNTTVFQETIKSKELIGKGHILKGMSGGPLYNQNGSVVGTVLASLDRKYAVATPIKQITSSEVMPTCRS